MTVKFSVVPSKEKWRIFRYAAPFCEQAIALTSNGKPEILDFPKLRLLSPFRKETRGVGDEDANPAIGKALQLGRMLSWTDPVVRKDDIWCLFIRNLRNFLPLNFHLGLPVQWGGFGVGRCDPDIIPKWYRQLIMIREDQTETLAGTPPIVDQVIADRILQSYNQHCLTERGVQIDVEADAFSAYLGLYAGMCFPLEVVCALTEPPIEPHLNLKAKRKRLEQAGYLALDQVCTQLCQLGKSLDTQPDRGFKSLSFDQRRKRQLRMVKAANWEFANPREVDVSRFREVFDKGPQDLLITTSFFPAFQAAEQYLTPPPTDRFFLKMKNREVL